MVLLEVIEIGTNLKEIIELVVTGIIILGVLYILFK